jgi:hypothetical protein
MDVSLGQALRMGWTGLLREPWLVALGLLTALLRRGLGVPVLAVSFLLLARGAWRAHQLAPWSGEAPALGAAWVAAQPRVVALALALSLAAALLGWSLRLLLVAGALPSLAGAMSEEGERPPRFAAGVAWGLPRLLPTALLALALEWTGQLLLAGLALGALQISMAALGSGRVALAAVVAAALLIGLVAALLASAVADAALVRTAVRGDSPVEAVLQAASRVLARPAPYLLALLGFTALSLASTAAIEALGSVATGFAARAPALLTLGPR